MPPKWPHDHSAKHARAARKGWANRAKKFGGGAQHTVKLHHLKERKKAAPRPAAQKTMPMTKPKYVISEGRDKRWRIIRLYPDGHTSGLPGTYATKAAAEKEVDRETKRGGQLVKSGLFDSETLF